MGRARMTEPLSVELRFATLSDAEAISALVLDGVGPSLADPDGEDALAFHAAMAPDLLRRWMRLPTRFYVVAEMEGQVRGMIMIRDGHWIGQFFVDRAFRGRGIGTALWAFAKAEALRLGIGGEPLHVDSSLAAVPVYLSFGFEVIGPVTEAHGFRFITMRRPPDAEPAHL